jgi:hypothetical protein
MHSIILALQENIKINRAIVKYPGSPDYNICAAAIISRITSAVDTNALYHANIGENRTYCFIQLTS